MWLKLGIAVFYSLGLEFFKSQLGIIKIILKDINQIIIITIFQVSYMYFIWVLSFIT